MKCLASNGRFTEKENNINQFLILKNKKTTVSVSFSLIFFSSQANFKLALYTWLFFGQVCGCCGWEKQHNIQIWKTTFEQWLASFSILQTKSDSLCTYDRNWFIEAHVSPHVLQLWRVE